MTHTLRSSLALAAVVALTAAAGCGEGASKPVARLIGRADAICGPVNARRKAANAAAGTVTNQQALSRVARIAPGLAAYERRAIAELHGLTAPAALAGDWRELLAGLRQLADNTARFGADAKARDLKAAQTLVQDSLRIQRRLVGLAARDGFSHCGLNT